MSNQVIDQAAALHGTETNLQNWAPAVPQVIENYPNYWQLKGWTCIIAANRAA